MHAGQRVTYVAHDGVQYAATVTELGGHGASTFKVLGLSWDGGSADDVPHEHDKGLSGYWRLGEPEAQPEIRRRRKDPSPSTPVEE